MREALKRGEAGAVTEVDSEERYKFRDAMKRGEAGAAAEVEVGERYRFREALKRGEAGAAAEDDPVDRLRDARRKGSELAVSFEIEFPESVGRLRV